MQFSTLLITLIFTLSLTTALPYTNITTTNSTACSKHPFQIIGLKIFAAPAGDRSPTTPETFGASHLSFLFIDPNFGRPGSCIRSLALGAGGNFAHDDPGKGEYHFCVGNPSLTFRFDGNVLGLKHEGDCGGKDIVTSGCKDIQGDIRCFPAFNGTSCIANNGTIEIPITDVVA